MNMKSNMKDFVKAKFQVKMRNFLAIIALVAVIGFLTACEDENNGTAPTITTTALPYGTVGVTYSITIAATGDSPITWSIESGEIPDGLTLSAGGVITGTPTTAKTYTFTIKATNIAGKDTSSLSITTDIPPTQTRIDVFEEWLDGQPANTATTPYGVKLNVSALGGTSDDEGSVGKVIKDSGKFVSVDLSGSSFTSIENNAFQNCTNLTNIIIPNSVTSIGTSVFFDCGITSVTLPTNTNFNTINEIAFCFCTNLTSITIPASVTTIGDHAFFASGLTSIRFESDNNTLIISSDAFVNGVNTTSLLTAYSDEDNGGIGTYTRQNTSSTTWTKEKS